ncbi:MAG TPA: glycosyltransferase family 2 protein [Thermoanaerobaculia bacterium]|nr:glycosyltransferase family 2 protein [Thermoanaerobaculia bacterium]
MRLWPWRRRRTRILALLTFRNEMRFLPDYFENVRPLVDGIVALDDGSTDGSAEFVARQPEVLQLLRLPPRADHTWDDALNHRRLVEAAWEHRPDWLLGLDADERLEKGFRDRAEEEIARARREGHRAWYLHVREIWDDPLFFRADGVWGRKKSARFFEARRDHEFHMQRLHCYWAPLNSRGENGDFPQADLFLYHLRMLTPADRAARQARYESLDPGKDFQSIGYSYMTDTEGLRLERIAPGREYRPLPR